MKKFNDYRNIIGPLVKEHREQKKYTKTELSHKLELLCSVTIDVKQKI